MYVQDRLRQSGALVWGLLQGGAHFYVCGDAAHMAGAVEDVLLGIIREHQASSAPSITSTTLPLWNREVHPLSCGPCMRCTLDYIHNPASVE